MAEYIDKEALLDAVWKLDVRTGIAVLYTGDVLDLIQGFPKVDVALVRRGQWVDKMVRDWHCSECGKAVPKQVTFDGYCYSDKLNFCPNCGAYMGDTDNGERKSGTQL